MMTGRFILQVCITLYMGDSISLFSLLELLQYNLLFLEKFVKISTVYGNGETRTQKSLVPSRKPNRFLQTGMILMES